MERRLLIIRHGKSSWDHEGLDDIDRPLSDRGIRNAGEMARRLLERGTVPQLILSSPANRALNTALIMLRTWEMDTEKLQIHDPLYMAYVSEIEEVVAGVAREVKDLAVFGHNPSFTEYANRFLDEPLDNLPTAGVVELRLDTDDWNGIGRRDLIAAHVDYPKRK